MNVSDENELETDNWDMPVTAQLPGFRPEEMADCPKCRRKNAPDRPVCMYCGSALQVSADQNLRIAERVLEVWESGFNVIATDFPTHPSQATEFDALTAEALDLSANKPPPIPVRRTETIAEAEHIARRLRVKGFQTLVVGDETLDVNELPTRIRGLELTRNVLRLFEFNTGEAVDIETGGLRLLVTGTIITGRTETLEKRKRGNAKILDESSAETREMVIDLYARNEPGRFRILERGFDFACLGNEKEMVASRNMAKLSDKLYSFAGDECAVTTYDQVRPVLDIVWPPEVRRETRGMVRSGFARKDLGRKQTVSYLEQFTRYSRMLNYLK